MLFWPLLIVPPLSLGLLNLPFYAAQTMGPDGYLAPILAALMALPGLAAVYLLARRFPGQTLVEQGETTLGPVLGRVTGLAYLGLNLLTMTTFARDLVNLAISSLIERTPLLVAVVVLVLAEAFLAARGIETLARLASFLLLPALLVMVVLMVLGLRNVSLTHLQPLIQAHRLSTYIRGGWSVLYGFYILGVSAMVLPFLTPIRSFPRLIGSALGVVTFFFVIFSVGAIGTFGSGHVRHFAWPALEFVHSINYPYLLLEQAGLLLLIDWLAMIFVGMSFQCYAIALGVSQVFGVLDYKRMLVPVTTLKVILFMLPPGIASTKLLFSKIAWYGWIGYFAYPLFLWLIAVLLGRKGKSDAT